MAVQQTYANHVRWFPLVHFVIIPLLTINLIYQSIRLYQEPSWDRGFWLVLSVVFILMVSAARLQSLKAQDRVIRLEERLRYSLVLPPELLHRTAAISESHMIALRFASDEQLGELVGKTLAGELTTSKEIKSAIKNWRADSFRV